jgi:hypothetical protein
MASVRVERCPINIKADELAGAAIGNEIAGLRGSSSVRRSSMIFLHERSDAELNMSRK